MATEVLPRIFRLGILPRRKTAHIHVRRPSGLGVNLLAVHFRSGKAKSECIYKMLGARGASAQK
jgi:hypothetical protein